MTEASETVRVECPAAKDPSVRMFIMAGMFIAFGVYCFYDTFYGPYQKPKSDGLNDMVTFWFNRGGAFVFPLIGLVPLVRGFVLLRQRVVADEEGVGYVGRERLAWSDVTRLDAKDLKTKGILRLEHGEGRRLILDSWKLTNFKALVAFVEKHVPPEAIDVRKPAGSAAPQAGDSGEADAGGG